MRVAVVDIGTNSTRLLIADVSADGALHELHRESIVTRLGARVDATGRLQEDAMRRVFDTLKHMRDLIDEHDATATTAVLTSAVRDAANGPEFTAIVRERYDLDARTIGGDEEAALTFAGATSERADARRELLVVDIGGGSTEFVIGCDGEVGFHVSTQAGVVRQTERHIEHDPYDRALVHGHILRRPVISAILGQLSRLTDAERRAVIGLQPDRAPTIIAGVAMLLEVLDAFGLDAIEVSEHDILRGAALRLAATATATHG